MNPDLTPKNRPVWPTFPGQNRPPKKVGVNCQPSLTVHGLLRMLICFSNIFVFLICSFLGGLVFLFLVLFTLYLCTSSYGDCLEVKREYYQNSSVPDCVTQNVHSSQFAAHLYEQFLQVQQIGFVTLGPLCCA